MAKILLDFDSVTADLGLAQVNACNEMFGTAYTVEDIAHWHWWDERGPYGRYVWGDECFNNREWTLNIPPMEGAIESLKLFQLMGDEFYVVSDRQPYMREWLEAWFDRHKFWPSDLVITNRDGYTKLDAARDLGLVVAIDDAEHNVLAFRDSGLFKRVILFDRSWNRHVECDGTLLVRVMSW